MEMTNLEWALQYVMYKIQDMIFHGRKTEQCGVILVGTEGTRNLVSDRNGGYENVTEYIPIAQPNAGTLAKISAIEPSSIAGDPTDGLIVGIETQTQYLGRKVTWTRKMVLVTDGESHIGDDWEEIAEKIKELEIKLAILGVDFDDAEFGYKEEDKSAKKRRNEKFWATFAESCDAIVGTCAQALQDVTRPTPKETNSAALNYELRVGAGDHTEDDWITMPVKVSKATALERPPSMKKFAKRHDKREGEDGIPDDVDPNKDDVYGLLKARTDYFMDREPKDGEEAVMQIKTEAEDGEGGETVKNVVPVEKEKLTRAYKYGATWVDVEDDFERLSTKKGIDICAFFPASKLRRELFMGEMQHVWADRALGQNQVAFGSLVQAMHRKDLVAITRWVSRDSADPKMGVLMPKVWDKIDSFLWAQLPFADDVRKYTFPSFDNLVSKKGEKVTQHAFLPTKTQMTAMEHFVDSMDLMHAGPKDESGEREPWFDPAQSYNPALHRIKQALFHAAVVPDLNTHPLPLPHAELLKYFEPPPKVVKRAESAIKDCIAEFKVQQVVKVVGRRRKEAHAEADDDMSLVLGPRADQKDSKPTVREPSPTLKPEVPVVADKEDVQMDDGGSETEPDDDDNLPKQEKAIPPPSPTLVPSTANEEPMDIDPQIPEGRIIGAAFPLRDFKKNIATGDVVSKAVEDLAFIIMDIIIQPFAKRRHQEMIECLRELRTVCLTEDEIDVWNESIRELKDVCLAAEPPNNKTFWSEIQAVGKPLGLITQAEAKKAGGKSSVSDAAAERVSIS
ncbi:SPOC domain-like protein [Sistotremastrum suecicum HHB10207 ss-3]|uniref:ATP-dependent DNA helicase II subunit 2 n=1 Tax=Sistotremastrum suecicum HHB10207 ss-3 TaxID=1314776 RepID=A0A166HIC1_9AGAM|nr:SPOC domain-like protein [Sistotremastrum suecicum HHB10207 ss-3]